MKQHHAVFLCRVAEVDPPAGSGSVRSSAGGRAAALHLGAAEGQGTLGPGPATPFTTFRPSSLTKRVWVDVRLSPQVFLCVSRLGLTVKPGSSPVCLSS